LDAEKKALLSLTLVPRIGSSNIKHLISYAGSASAVHNLSLSRLLKIPGIGHKGANSIKNGSLMEKATEIFQQAESESCHVLSYLDKAYPYRLKQIADAPPIIFSKGQWPLSSERPTLAIIGSRNATDNGRRLTNEIIDALSPLKPIILSGLAYGIDITAHKAALRNKLSTYAVLGSGIDFIYPSIHKPIALEMQENGGLITEQVFGAKPEAFNFPARNRIIAGMADLVVVVEAARKGGALITAELANSYDREVAAFPGRVGDIFSEGCNKLIKNNQAHLIESAEDILSLMNWEMDNQAKIKQKVIDFSQLNEKEQAVIHALLQNNKELSLDLLSIKSQIGLNQLAGILLGLELNGIIRTLPGKRYQIA
jgi:DNA processing protein